MKHTAAFITGRRTAWVVLLDCVIALGLALALVPRPSTVAQPNPATAGDSLRTAQWLTHVPSADTTSGIVVWTRSDGQPFSDAQRSAIDVRAAAVRALTSQPRLAWTQLSPDRTIVLVQAPIPTSTVLKDAPAVAGTLLGTARSGLPAGVQVKLTGPLETLAAATHATNGSTDLALDISLLVLAAILLILATRSVVLWLVPLVFGAASATLAVFVGADLARAAGLAYTAQASQLVFAASLALVTAFSLVYVMALRRALAGDRESHPAAARALSTTLAGIGASAIILLAGCLVFLFAADSRVRALGLAIALGTVLAALTAILAVPAALAIVGRPSLWLRLPSTSGGAGGPARRFARGTVLATFVTAVILSVVMTGAAAAVVGSMTPSNDRQSAQARADIDRAFTPGYENETVMIVPNSLAGDTSILAPTTLAMNLPHAHAVTVGDSYRGFSALTAQFDIDPGSAASLDTIAKLRQLIASKGDPTATTLVGGADAAILDQRSAATTDYETVVPIAIVLVLLLLFLADLRERRAQRSTS